MSLSVSPLKSCPDLNTATPTPSAIGTSNPRTSSAHTDTRTLTEWFLLSVLMDVGADFPSRVVPMSLLPVVSPLRSSSTTV